MKRSAKTIGNQFNLALITAAPIAVSEDKQIELKRAIIELLTSAARRENATRRHGSGDEDEYEVNR